MSIINPTDGTCGPEWIYGAGMPGWEASSANGLRGAPGALRRPVRGPAGENPPGPRGLCSALGPENAAPGLTRSATGGRTLRDRPPGPEGNRQAGG